MSITVVFLQTVSQEEWFTSKTPTFMSLLHLSTGNFLILPTEAATDTGSAVIALPAEVAEQLPL